MKALFYINPFIVRSNPQFYHGALKNKLIRQAKLLSSSNVEVSFLLNEFTRDVVARSEPEFDVITLPSKELDLIHFKYNNIESELYEGNQFVIDELSSLISKHIQKKYDFVIAWETPANFFKKILPDVKVFHQMPGFLSRVPYPELLTFDDQGLFNESSLSRNSLNKIDIDTIDEENIKKLKEFIRYDLVEFISDKNPYKRSDLDPDNKFEKLILLPLQVTEQYAFLTDCHYKSQFDLLLDVVRQIPNNIGIVVTQYNTGSTSEEVINKNNFELYKSVYPNLIWIDGFSKLDHISQYLLSLVDAVVTVSSSIGLQALLWNKQLVALGNNYLREIADYVNINDYIENNRTEVSPLYKEKFLSWMLGYQQPLAVEIHKNEDFFLGLIQARMKPENISFFDIHPDYYNRFVESAKTELAIQKLSNSYGISVNNKTVDSFKEKIKTVNPEIISFDIFDTLIDRAIEQPAHIFKLIEPKVDKITEGVITNFQTIRQTAERNVRSLLPDGKQEMTMDEIYDEIHNITSVPRETLARVQELEIEYEFKNIRARKIGLKLYREAKKANKKIIFISDMYLDAEVVRKILVKTGYNNNDNLYLSSSVFLRKHEGDLFKYVQEIENVSFDRWLHVGDNPHGDIKAPGALGISTYHIKSAFRNIETNKKIFELLKNDRRTRTIGESAVYGLIQRKFFDDQHNLYPGDTHFGGNASILGYAGFAPMMFGFLHWLMMQAKRDGVDHLVFLSRDGKVLYRMAGILFPENEGWPKTSYALSSRRAARVASLYTKSDINKLIDSAISNSTLNTFFNGKFGLDISDVSVETLREFGFNSVDSRISQSDREKLKKLADYLQFQILDNAKQERELLSSYYEDLGINNGNNIGVVDIGYAGTMQVAMEKITSATNIRGYYYITFDSALEQLEKTGVMRGYAGDFVKRTIHPDSICRNGFLYETLFCSSDSSFISFKKDNKDKVIPIFNDSYDDSIRKSIVDQVHNACVIFARDLRDIYDTDIKYFYLNSITASKLFNSFIANPGGRDAEIFEGCVFEDAFSGVKLRYIVPPRQLLLENKYARADYIWVEGTSVFARRPDIFSKKEQPNKKNIVLLKKKEVIVDKVKEDVNDYTDRVSLNDGKKGLRVRLEEKLIIKFLKNERKVRKYKSDRIRFFSDSKSKMLRCYWSAIGEKL